MSVISNKDRSSDKGRSQPNCSWRGCKGKRIHTHRNTLSCGSTIEGNNRLTICILQSKTFSGRGRISLSELDNNIVRQDTGNNGNRKSRIICDSIRYRNSSNSESGLIQTNSRRTCNGTSGGIESYTIRKGRSDCPRRITWWLFRLNIDIINTHTKCIGIRRIGNSRKRERLIGEHKIPLRELIHIPIVSSSTFKEFKFVSIIRYHIVHNESLSFVTRAPCDIVTFIQQSPSFHIIWTIDLPMNRITNRHITSSRDTILIDQLTTTVTELPCNPRNCIRFETPFGSSQTIKHFRCTLSSLTCSSGIRGYSSFSIDTTIVISIIKNDRTIEGLVSRRGRSRSMYLNSQFNCRRRDEQRAKGWLGPLNLFSTSNSSHRGSSYTCRW